MGFSVRCVKDEAVINTKLENATMDAESKIYLPKLKYLIGEYSYRNSYKTVYTLTIKADNTITLYNDNTFTCMWFSGKWVYNNGLISINFTEFRASSCEDEGKTNIKCVFKAKKMSGKDIKKIKLELISWINSPKKGDFHNYKDVKEYGFKYFEKL